MRWVVNTLVAASLAVAGSSVLAQEAYPSKPVRLIVNFPPGGPLDFIARSISKSASEGLRQAIVVENQPGAAGSIGAATVGRAEPDGHTILVTIDTPITANPHAYGNEDFDPRTALEPLGIAGKYSQVLVVHPSLGVSTFNEFLDLSRTKDLSYSSAGVASPGHLQFELLRERTGLNAVHIPYKGNAPAVQALVGGEVQAGFLATAGALPHIRSGRLTPLMAPGSRREPALPEVPAAAELGIPNFDIDGAFVLLAPRGVSEAVKTAWRAELKRLFDDEEFLGTMRKMTFHPEVMDATDTQAWLDKTSGYWGEIIHKRAIRLE